MISLFHFSNLFEDQIVCTPTRTHLARRCKANSTPIQNIDSDSSSDYEPSPRKLTLKEIFDRHFRKKRKKYKKKPKNRNQYLCSEKKQPQKVRKTRKPVYSISASERKGRLLHRGIRFPFASKKHLSLKWCFAYEVRYFQQINSSCSHL